MRAPKTHAKPSKTGTAPKTGKAAAKAAAPASPGGAASPEAARSPGLIWERPEPAARPAPAPLSREAIVGAALRLARDEGIEAVSLRNIGRALDVGPMRLYGYIESKEELLDLVVDALYADLLEGGPLPGPWRAALTEIARRLRAVAHAHPWFPGLLSGRPNVGPNALAYLEAALGTLANEPRVSIDAAVEAIRVLHAYVIGAVQTEANDLRAARETGLDEEAFRDHHAPYLFRTLARGQHPTLQRVVEEHVHTTPDATFARGLAWVLDGIEANLRRGG